MATAAKGSDVKRLFSAGAHFAQVKSRRHPSMKPFVLGAKGRSEIIDLSKTEAQLESAKSVAEARKMLAADKALALEMIRKAGEKDLAGKIVPAPWDPTQKPLGHQCLGMIQHLASHKSQLFYYLKLQGKPVHTGNLWGM